MFNKPIHKIQLWGGAFRHQSKGQKGVNTQKVFRKASIATYKKTLRTNVNWFENVWLKSGLIIWLPTPPSGH